MTTSAFLNKSEASHFLHCLYDDYIIDNKLADIHPDFYSILSENTRNPLSVDAIKKGHPRGNRGKYSKIDCIRIAGRPMFIRSKLTEWFILHYAPKLEEAAA
ncbi:hypothetical protein [Methylobacter sp. BBA5.1]|uniref:hypothetical protein n=1 Tax=Methylobacter sp. BBA5.1 TaxID=1495064 RepID=UPI00056625AE|nr:hypothetical protein [Methylobacter sp. BBA5.1]